MSQIRQYLPIALLFALIIFVCVRLLLVPVQRPDAFFGARCENGFDSGWPFSFMECQADWDSQLQQFIPTARVWHSGSILAADIAVVSLVIALAGFALWRWGPRRIRPRFSIRSLLLLVVLIAAGCAWWVHQRAVYQQEQPSIASLKAAGFLCEAECCAPPWLQKLWPTKLPYYFDRVVSIAWVEPFTNGADPKEAGPWLEAEAPQFHQLKSLQLDTPIFPHLNDPAPFSSIEKLEVRVRSSDRSIDFICQWPRLRKVICMPTLDGPNANQLASLAKCPALESLRFWWLPNYNSEVGEQFARMKRLRELEMMSVRALDDDVPFARLPALEKLTIENADGMSDKAMRRVLEMSTLKELKIYLWNGSEETKQLIEQRFGK